MAIREKFINNLMITQPDEIIAFQKALEIELKPSIKLNPKKRSSISTSEKILSYEMGAFLEPDFKSFLDPLFHAGAYDFQESNSMILNEILSQLNFLNEGKVILDANASTGFLSTQLLSWMTDKDLLVSNEIVKITANHLKENLCKWGDNNAIVTTNDSRDFKELKSLFDLVLLNAPCSGEGLIRKGGKSIETWDEGDVEQYADRQKETIRNHWTSLKENGYFILMVNAYNAFETEQNVDLLKSLGGELQSIEINPALGAKEMSFGGYQFYPHTSQGAGLFVAVVRKTNGYTKEIKIKNNSIRLVSREERKFLEESAYLKNKNDFILTEKGICAIPYGYWDMLFYLTKNLIVIQTGIFIGELKKKKFIPSPELAFAGDLNKEMFSVYDLTHLDALDFLSKNEMNVKGLETGLNLLTFDGAGLGWCKNLGNRINNNYPKEWVLKYSYKNEKLYSIA